MWWWRKLPSYTVSQEARYLRAHYEMTATCGSGPRRTPAWKENQNSGLLWEEEKTTRVTMMGTKRSMLFCWPCRYMYTWQNWHPWPIHGTVCRPWVDGAMESREESNRPLIWCAWSWTWKGRNSAEHVTLLLLKTRLWVERHSLLSFPPSITECSYLTARILHTVSTWCH